MILHENKSDPIVGLLIKSAADTIKEKTGVDFPADDIEQELFDCEWLFGVNIDDEENYVDMTELVKQIDYIIERNIKYINDEKEQEGNVDF